MIGEEKLHRTQRLLSAGKPKRRIAREVGISLTTVDEIAAGIKRRRVRSNLAPGCRGTVGRCRYCRTLAEFPSRATLSQIAAAANYEPDTCLRCLLFPDER